jgi:putative endonuclease
MSDTLQEIESLSESKREYGLQVEARALEWLVERNPDLRLVGRNLAWKGGELDLVFEENSELVFVEVRARVAGWVSGIESVDFKKQLRLARTIDWFLARYRGQARSARVDVVEWDGTRFRHYRDIRLRS